MSTILEDQIAQRYTHKRELGVPVDSRGGGIENEIESGRSGRRHPVAQRERRHPNLSPVLAMVRDGKEIHRR